MFKNGIVLVFVGLCGIAFGLSMDTTRDVAAIGFSRIYNIGLMEQQRDWLGLSALSIVCGVMLIGFDTMAKRNRYAIPFG